MEYICAVRGKSLPSDEFEGARVIASAVGKAILLYTIKAMEGQWAAWENRVKARDQSAHILT